MIRTASGDANAMEVTPASALYASKIAETYEWWKKNSSTSNTRALRSVVVMGKAGMPGFGKKLT